MKQAQIREVYQGQVLRVRARAHGARAGVTRTNRCELGSRVKGPLAFGRVIGGAWDEL